MSKNELWGGVLIMILSAGVFAEQRSVSGCIAGGTAPSWPAWAAPAAADTAYVPRCERKCEQRAWARYEWQSDLGWGRRLGDAQSAIGSDDENNSFAYCGDLRTGVSNCAAFRHTHWCMAADGYPYFTLSE